MLDLENKIKILETQGNIQHKQIHGLIKILKLIMDYNMTIAEKENAKEFMVFGKIIQDKLKELIK